MKCERRYQFEEIEKIIDVEVQKTISYLIQKIIDEFRIVYFKFVFKLVMKT